MSIRAIFNQRKATYTKRVLCELYKNSLDKRRKHINVKGNLQHEHSKTSQNSTCTDR
jgi:hypothetical protein